MSKNNYGWRYFKLQEARYGITKYIESVKKNLINPLKEVLEPLEEMIEFEKIEIFRDDVISNCCSAPITELDDKGVGRCSKCQEMCKAEKAKN